MTDDNSKDFEIGDEVFFVVRENKFTGQPSEVLFGKINLTKDFVCDGGTRKFFRITSEDGLVGYVNECGVFKTHEEAVDYHKTLIDPEEYLESVCKAQSDKIKNEFEKRKKRNIYCFIICVVVFLVSICAGILHNNLKLI